MGSSQSVSTSPPNPSLPEDSKTTGVKKVGKASAVDGLTGVASIERKCRRKKRAWGSCVREHYEHQFLPGRSLEPDEADCDDLFEAYRRCYLRGLLKQRRERGMDLPREGTMLHGFMEEEGMLPDSDDGGGGVEKR